MTKTPSGRNAIASRQVRNDGTIRTSAAPLSSPLVSVQLAITLHDDDIGSGLSRDDIWVVRGLADAAEAILCDRFFAANSVRDKANGFALRDSRFSNSPTRRWLSCHPNSRAG